MTKLLEIKERIVRFCEEYDTAVRILLKFIIALMVFFTISSNIGYDSRLTRPVMNIALALVCSLLPSGITVLLAGLLVCAHMYKLCVEAALVTAILFAIIVLVYFRFTSKGSNAAILTPVAFHLGIPYVMPIGVGLLGEIYTTISVVCGTVVYYFLSGIHQNAAALANTEVETAEKASELSKSDIVLGQLIGNREMLLVVGVIVLASIVTYVIRRIETDHAWAIAVIAGGAFQIVGLFAGYLILGLPQKLLGLMLGGIVSVAIGFVMIFFFMNLDYNRVERAQFEDDEYFYYVKAIPKRSIATEEKVVKHYGNTGSMGKRIERRNPDEVSEEVSKKDFAKEMEIDEDLLD